LQLLASVEPLDIPGRARARGEEGHTWDKLSQTLRVTAALTGVECWSAVAAQARREGMIVRRAAHRPQPCSRDRMKRFRSDRPECTCIQPCICMTEDKSPGR
jgi:hypothetical protein